MGNNDISEIPTPNNYFQNIINKWYEYLPCIVYRISYCIMFYYISIKQKEIRQNSPLTPPALLVLGPCLSSETRMLPVLVHYVHTLLSAHAPRSHTCLAWLFH